MNTKRLHSVFQWGAVIMLLFLFCYFRIKPIVFQTVPYTYDQGRDFLKAEEIVRYHNLTFIGPTTGIAGLHHGAWWYYFLSIVFFIFNGWPNGFYFGIFLYTLFTTLFFFFFLKRTLGYVSALLFLAFMTTAPYFIRISFFPGNNILTPGIILLFIAAVYTLLKNPQPWTFFLTGFALGMVTETEVSFGLFLLPAFFVVSVLYEEFRSARTNWRAALFFMSGLFIPFIPRLLFNLKHGFIELIAALTFLRTTPPTNPQSFFGAVGDRGDLFVRYFMSMIYENDINIAIGLVLFTISAFIFGTKRARSHEIRTFVYFVLILCFVFLFSLSNKNNFFWDNYLEGIQYFYVYLIVFAAALIRRIPGLSRSVGIVMMLFFSFAFISFARDITKPPTSIASIGLRADRMTVEYVLEKAGGKDFCVKIYTPPAVPYTYRYLFSYYSKIKGHMWPHEEWYQNRCYFIIDPDEYAERVAQWRRETIPESAELLNTHTMQNGAIVEHWYYEQ